MKNRRFPFLGKLNKVRLFTGCGGVKGGRCRVLLLPISQTGQQAAMET